MRLTVCRGPLQPPSVTVSSAQSFSPTHSEAASEHRFKY
jgi:hypothetical protein